MEHLALIVWGVGLALVVGLIVQRKNPTTWHITKWQINMESGHYRWTIFWLKLSFWKPDYYCGECQFRPKSLCSYFWFMVGAPWMALWTGSIYTFFIGVAVASVLAVEIGFGGVAVWWLYDPLLNLCSKDIAPEDMAECIIVAPDYVMYLMLFLQGGIWWATLRHFRDKTPIPVIGSAASVGWEFAKSVKYGVCPRLDYIDPKEIANEIARQEKWRQYEIKAEEEAKAEKKAEKKAAGAKRKTTTKAKVAKAKK